MAVCLYFYIEYFSPGYAWHGFTIRLFIVTFVAFRLLGVQPARIFNWKCAIIGIVVGIQDICRFAIYVPLQAKWHVTTEEAIRVIENKENEIYSDVVSLLSEINYSFLNPRQQTIMIYQNLSKTRVILQMIQFTNMCFG